MRPVVLVVEDEPIILLGAAALVKKAGMEAVEASNADRAIKALEARNDICVIFTDINMPGSMDGLGLVAIVRERWPLIRVIITTGRGVPDALPEHAHFLKKPYSFSELERALKALTAA